MSMRISRKFTAIWTLYMILTILLCFTLDNFSTLNNIFQGLETKSLLEQPVYLNWEQTEQGLISEQDPQIIITDINDYIRTVELSGTISDVSREFQIYYQDPGDVDFTAEKALHGQWGKPIKIERTVQALRFDFTEQAGIVLQLEDIVANPRTFRVSGNAIFLWVIMQTFIVVAYHYKHVFLELWTSQEIMRTLIINDVKSRYAGSFLGSIWAFVQPIMTIIVFWFVFERGFRNAPVANLNYILWFIPAYIPWVYFQDGLTYTAASLREYSYLVKKMKFNVSILPVIRVCSSAIVHGCFIFFMLFVYLCYRRPFSVYYFQLLYYFFALTILLFGIGWLVAAITVFFKDFLQLINILLQLGFFMIPVFWSADQMDPFVVTILKLNPIYYIVDGYRDCMINNLFFWEKPGMTIYYWAITLLIFCGGIGLFQKVKKHFADML